jgi:transcriptional regulator of acetoin/glycerol metabolism
VSHEAIACLMRYDWPGNIRELRNLVEAIFIDPPQREIGLDDLPPHLRHIVEERREGGAGDRERLLEALTSTRWNVTRAAKVLHWSRMTVYRKIAKYQLVRARRRRGEAAHPPR